jgi:hypothetical protein
MDGNRWFTTVGYWLYPKGLVFELFEPNLDARLEEIEAAEAALDSHTFTGSVANILEAKNLTRSIRARADSREYYNAQPNWHLIDIEVSPEDAHALIAEFERLTSYTTEQYGWPGEDPGKGVDWRVHGWKHICFVHIQGYWQEYVKGWAPPATIADGIGSPNDVVSLFRAAENGDPEAVGRVWTLFPNREGHEDIFFFFFKSNERPKAIPDPNAVAEELVRTIFSAPRSEEASQARAALLKLIAPSVSRGGKAKRGRPKSMVPPDILCLVWKMSYSLARQVREVVNLLSQLKISRKGRDALLLEMYPWMASLKTWDILSFSELEPSAAGLVIAEHVTGLSKRFIERTGIRSDV